MIYAMSDLHGYPLEKVEELLNKAGFCENDYCFVLGDVIDRGKDGVKILKWMMRRRNIQLILGNHEAMLLSCDFLFDTITEQSVADLNGTKLRMLATWQANGAAPTIEALQLLRPSEIKYISEYLREAPLFETVTVSGRDFLLTHSGLGGFAPDKRMSDYSPDDLLWNRPRLTDCYFDDITVVFGHTPTLYLAEEYKGRAIFTDTWIDIDAGASCGLPPMLLRLDDMQEFYL